MSQKMAKVIEEDSSKIETDLQIAKVKIWLQGSED